MKTICKKGLAMLIAIALCLAIIPSGFTNKNCKKIKSFTVGKNVTKIGSSAFSGISKNAKFKVPKSKLFNMAKMIKSAKAPKNVKVTY